MLRKVASEEIKTYHKREQLFADKSSLFSKSIKRVYLGVNLNVCNTICNVSHQINKFYAIVHIR